MIIHATKKVLDAAHIESIPENEETVYDTRYLLHSWHANVITVDRRKVLFFMNDLTQLTVIFLRPKQSDYKHLPEILKEGITALMRELGYHEDVINKYIADDTEDLVIKTSDKALISRMNHTGTTVEFSTGEMDSEHGLQMSAMIRVGNDLVDMKAGYYVPLDKFQEEIKRVYGKGLKSNILDHRSYVLKVELALEGHEIYRIIEVPYSTTFRKLHQAIQIVFDWLEYHIHSFDILDNDGDDIYSAPVKMSIYDSEVPPEEEYMQEGCEYRNELSVRVHDIFDQEDRCIYTYDFGDDWKHIITVLERKKTGGKEYITMLEQKGERPPEDIGGEAGYEEYLRIILDPDDPEYEEMMFMAESTGPEDLTDSEINRKLRWLS